MALVGTKRLDPAGRQRFWWYHPDPVEVRIGEDTTYHTTTAGVDPNGRSGWGLLIAGPFATSNPAGTIVVEEGTVKCVARTIGTESAVGRSSIDCR